MLEETVRHMEGYYGKPVIMELGSKVTPNTVSRSTSISTDNETEHKVLVRIEEATDSIILRHFDIYKYVSRG